MQQIKAKLGDLELTGLLALSQHKLVGAILAKRIYQYTQQQNLSVWDLDKVTLRQVQGVNRPLIDTWDLQPFKTWAEDQLALTQKHGDTLVSISSKHYPPRLLQIPDAPLLLFLKGDPAALYSRKKLAVIGTRNITDRGKMYTDKFVAGMQSYDVQIVSGLAHGVDTMGHRAALKHGLKTGAVLGHGLQTIYPNVNRKLSDKILDNGGFLLSEYPYGVLPDRQNFPTRNRIVAGMVDALLIIETAVKGGSMVTASYAQQYNRDVFVLPGRIEDAYSRGNLELVKHHLAHLITEPEEIAKEMRWTPEFEKQQPVQKPLIVADRFKAIYACLDQEKMLDEICLELGLGHHHVNAQLIEMELEGLVRILPGKKVARV